MIRLQSFILLVYSFLDIVFQVYSRSCRGVKRQHNLKQLTNREKIQSTQQS